MLYRQALFTKIIIKTVFNLAYFNIFALMKFIKQHIALLLLFVVASYSVDLHGLSHAFENDSANDDKQCEICILHHQHQKTSISILPTNDYFENQFVQDNWSLKVDFKSHQVVYHNLYFEGQHYNKPPPQSI